MTGSPQDTLYIVLAIAVALLTIFLCVTLIYLILILRDASKMLERVRDTADKVNNFILKPVSLASTIVDHVRPLIEAALERRYHESQDDEHEHKKKKKE